MSRRLGLTTATASTDGSPVALVLVALGAAMGAPTRWWVDVSIQRRWAPVFPWGTFIVNITGSGLLGAFAARWTSTSSTFALVGIGFCGSLTTFSSFAWETDRLATGGARWMAVANVVATVALCLGAAAIGWILVH
ncbi:MAG: fluoride efflux transporter FluC [Actinomycetes bacterium]